MKVTLARLAKVRNRQAKAFQPPKIDEVNMAMILMQYQLTVVIKEAIQIIQPL